MNQLLQEIFQIEATTNSPVHNWIKLSIFAKDSIKFADELIPTLQNILTHRIMLKISLPKHPLTMILLGAVFISFSGVFVKLAEISPTGSAFYRVLFGGCILLFPAVYNKELAIPTQEQFWLMVFCGFAFALDLFIWHESIMYIGPGLATILGNFQVFILSAIGILFLGEPLRGRFLAAIPLAVGGLFLIFGDGK